MFGGHGYNCNQIESAWCQTIGKGGRGSQLSGPYKEILIKNSNSIWTKVTTSADSCPSACFGPIRDQYRNIVKMAVLF